MKDEFTNEFLEWARTHLTDVSAIGLNILIDHIDESHARIAQLTAENERLQNDVNDYKGDIRYFKKTKDSQTETIDKLAAELADRKADAERLIQLANFNNARAGEYFDLHEQLVKKYEVKE